MAAQYLAHIERIERDRVHAELAGWQDVECESPLSITLVQALQAGDKMDFTIQKAVELGVRDSCRSRAGAAYCAWPVRRRQARGALAGVVASACEQCGRTRCRWWRRSKSWKLAGQAGWRGDAAPDAGTDAEMSFGF